VSEKKKGWLVSPSWVRVGKKEGTSKKKAVAKTAAVPSKRSGKRKVVRKAASTERRSALLASLRRRNEKPRETAFEGSSLREALDSIAQLPSKKGPPVFSGRTNKGKRLLLAAETEQLETVLAHPAFRADPTATILDHLANTLS